MKYSAKLWGFSHPKQLDDASLPGLKVNEYVQCPVDRYVVVPISEYHKDRVTGQSEEYIVFTKEYVTYTIAVGEDAYVRIMVCDNDVLNLLESFEMGSGRAVSFVGKVIAGDDLNDTWYNGAEDFNINNIRSDIVIK